MSDEEVVTASLRAFQGLTAVDLFQRCDCSEPNCRYLEYTLAGILKPIPQSASPRFLEGFKVFYALRLIIVPIQLFIRLCFELIRWGFITLWVLFSPKATFDHAASSQYLHFGDLLQVEVPSVLTQ